MAIYKHNKGVTLIAGEGTEVYGAAPPVAWTDLDLSAVVGKRPVLVILGISCASARYISFRTNGNTDIFSNASTGPAGVVSFVSEASGNHQSLIVLTDVNGVVEWICNSAATWAYIDVLGYIT